MIRKIIGKLTYPKDAVRCELGDSWIPTDLHPAPEWLNKYIVGDEHTRRYQYQMIKQNIFGWWVTDETYLGKNTPL